MKRLLSLILVLAMALTMSVAFAEETISTEYLVAEEPVTIKVVFVEEARCNTHEEMWGLQLLQQYTNVDIEMERISSDAWSERKALMFAADEQPEIIIGGGFTQAELAAYVDAGQIVPVTELYEEYMPHYKAFIESYDAMERAKLYMNGEMIGLVGNGGDGFGTIPGARAYINQTWLDNLGLETPTTWEEFYNVLVAFRDQDPNGNGLADEIPLGGYDGYQVDAFVTSDLGISVSWSEMSEWYEGENGELEYVFTSDRYYEYLSRMNKLYTEGLLDSEYYTQEDAQMKAKGTNGLIGACTYAAPFVLTSNDAELYRQYTAFMPLTGEYETEGAHYANMLSGANIYFTDKNEHLVESAKWVDFFYTEEWGLLQQGPEKGSEIVGDWNGEGGWYWLDDAQTTWTHEVPGEYAGSFEWRIMEIMPYSIRGSASSSEFSAKVTRSDGDVHLIEIFDDIWDYVVPCFPQSYSLTADESDQIALISTELDAYVDQMETKFVIGEISLEEGWEEFQSHLKDVIGVDEYIEVHRQAYARFTDGLAAMEG